jgi:hypothetical protein
MALSAPVIGGKPMGHCRFPEGEQRRWRQLPEEEGND